MSMPCNTNRLPLPTEFHALVVLRHSRNYRTANCLPYLATVSATQRPPHLPDLHYPLLLLSPSVLDKLRSLHYPVVPLMELTAQDVAGQEQHMVQQLQQQQEEQQEQGQEEGGAPSALQAKLEAWCAEQVRSDAMAGTWLHTVAQVLAKGEASGMSSDKQGEGAWGRMHCATHQTVQHQQAELGDSTVFGLWPVACSLP